MTGGDDLTDPAAVVARGISYTVDNMTDSVTRGAATTSFIYDDDGRRAKKTAGSNTTVYVNDLYEIINAAATKYIFAGNLRIAKITGTDIKYFHKDHLGSSTVMTGASGLSVETSEYLPYGGNRDQSGTSVSEYKFTDQELDTSTGLYNYDARLYDPVIGRFISPDSIVPEPFDPQSLNRYSYCRNNPLIYTDPTGHYRDFGMGDDVVGGTSSSDTEDAGDQDILGDDPATEVSNPISELRDGLISCAKIGIAACNGGGSVGAVGEAVDQVADKYSKYEEKAKKTIDEAVKENKQITEQLYETLKVVCKNVVDPVAQQQCYDDARKTYDDERAVIVDYYENIEVRGFFVKRRD